MPNPINKKGPTFTHTIRILDRENEVSCLRTIAQRKIRHQTNEIKHQLNVKNGADTQNIRICNQKNIIAGDNFVNVT